nr:putative PEP-binding protein [Streptomyces hirsutus]
MVHYVYAFTEGGRDMAGLLGGKGANLAEMTSLGLPVPPGFTVTTEACRSFLTTGSEPAGLAREISDHLAVLEQVAGRRLGQPDDPLLLSVRSGARFSMPGMMETILDIGLNDDSVLGLAKSFGNERFAWDSYRRLVQMFGSTVMGVDSALFESTMARLKQERGAVDDLGLDAADLAGLVEAYKEQVLAAVSKESGVLVACPVGTMIELPRAALTAGRIAEEAQFFSFGTNDLTQTTWGFSRDDVEAAFFSAYLDKGIFKVSPFETIDRDGVGRLVEIAVAEGRAARPGLKIGVCGEHGGDPESVHFFHAAGLDYVSCSPFRVPVARLEVGRAALSGTEVSDSR